MENLNESEEYALPVTAAELVAADSEPLEDLVLFGERWMARTVGALEALRLHYLVSHEDERMSTRFRLALELVEREVAREYELSGKQAWGRHVVDVGRRWGLEASSRLRGMGEEAWWPNEGAWMASALSYAGAIREGYARFMREASRANGWRRASDRILVAVRSAAEFWDGGLVQLSLQVAHELVECELRRHEQAAAAARVA